MGKILLLMIYLLSNSSLFAQEASKESFAFIPDTETIKSSWQDFFNTPVYLALSTSTRRELTDKLFSDLIASDTTYLAWDIGLQSEAKKIFYTRAGVPLEKSEKGAEAVLSAERIMSQDPSRNKDAITAKERRLGDSLVQSHDKKLPSPAAETDKTLPKTEIPKSEVKKFAMPVGRSWFSSPLEDLQNDPDFIGYMVIMKSRNSGDILVAPVR